MMEKKEFDKALVFQFEELVDYSTDAIISRTILNKQTGTVTIFAFDKGQSLSEHTAPFDAMVQVIDGEGIVSIAGKELSLIKGQSVILPANIPHALNASERFKMVLTMIRS